MQNSRLKKEILGQHKEVSAKELELYREGKLSAERAREIEMKLHSNEFSAEAAEGYETYGSDLSAAQVGESYRTKNYRPWYYSFLAVVIIGAGAFTFWPDNESVSETSAVSHLTESHAAEVLTPKEINQPTSVKPTAAQGQKKAPEVSLELKVEDPKEADKPRELPVLFSAEMEREIFKPSPIETKKADLNTTRNLNKPASISVNLRHYKNYKLVDQGFGIDQSLLAPILDGTPASSEIVYQRPEYPEWYSADSIYQLTINKSIDYIIDQKLGEAQFQLEKLIDLEDSDITATFYLGYVFFLKEDYKQAITFFNKTETHIIQTFDHDARFMEIKCLMALDRKEEAQKEVDFLVKTRSFYAEKAKELIAQ